MEEELTTEDLARLNDPFTAADLAHIKSVNKSQWKRKEIQESVGKQKRKELLQQLIAETKEKSYFKKPLCSQCLDLLSEV